MNYRLGSIMDNEENMAPSTFALFVYIGMVMLVMILRSWGHQGVDGGVVPWFWPWPCLGRANEPSAGVNHG